MSGIPKGPIPTPAQFVDIAHNLLAKNRGDRTAAAEDAAWRCVHTLQERGLGRSAEDDSRLLGWAAAYAAAAAHLGKRER